MNRSLRFDLAGMSGVSVASGLVVWRVHFTGRYGNDIRKGGALTRVVVGRLMVKMFSG